ncbi:cAMP-regulated phosphoprotein 19 [Linepithema humile]|uniref:cAMP-regulated phosphoprotein 19 n=1 Tax=Linepithema humile TaxID=83485 RepID=UPI0006230771|nr:PREDICTED: cAMP-regulated phosphoprotein 19 [Linepithema humile]
MESISKSVTMSDDQTNEQSSTTELSSSDIEKLEEAKLRAKFPNATGRPFGGHSAFLQKRLAKGQKYFDSGDYQMAKQKSTAKPKPTGVLPTGDAIPTPETVPQRKTSIIQQKFNTSTTSS